MTEWHYITVVRCAKKENTSDLIEEANNREETAMKSALALAQKAWGNREEGVAVAIARSGVHAEYFAAGLRGWCSLWGECAKETAKLFPFFPVREMTGALLAPVLKTAEFLESPIKKELRLVKSE